jgi:hypothetical protein
MWKLEANERIVRWRDFRSTLEAAPIELALASVSALWRDCPFSPYYLDPDDLSKWPDPWELLTENYYCDIAKSLGMLYTIYFTRHGKEHTFELRIYQDTKTNYNYNLVYIDQGKYILNLIDGQVVNKEHLEKTLKLEHKFTAEQLQLEKY